MRLIVTRIWPAAVLLTLCVVLALAIRDEADNRTRCDDGCRARGFELGLRVESRCLCAVAAPEGEG